MSVQTVQAPSKLPGEDSHSHVPSPSSARRASISLQAAATLNAGLHLESPSQTSPGVPFGHRSRESLSPERRRSQVLMSLKIADPSIPAPGEMASESHSSSGIISPSPRLGPMRPNSGRSHHSRTPSLGELHQELENEQERQVNRLLGEIRRLQEQLYRLQQEREHPGEDLSSLERPAPGSIPFSSAQPHSHVRASSRSLSRSPASTPFPYSRGSYDVSRTNRSRTPSRHASPRLRSISISADNTEPLSLGPSRDESIAFYQAENQSLTRENQMLKHRIRELERQLAEAQGAHASSITHEPGSASHLNQAISALDENVPSSKPATENGA
ncbi:uncharacterized protein CTHT_0033770 [Thermochaetoides thermophila DSM 1495]|uniref:Uncharacterized protein n=1 Tax=Chaetomium thermophilum (strain DSM 1495 / CBS 144.50 / IMI 039719) TaxID=759272 RepID=G0S5V6_CHATD|nr:hypothetical protein CTHT_0033770 [Thermochaetoides thermophila DSM 1495]EGS21518.1 hypothetical protein CTHT_0033770 [Thermochaetoides thermophila DSM 1495]